MRSPEGWHATHFVAAERAGYSGVGLFARKAPDDVETKLGVGELDSEGRLQVARFGLLTVVNCYFPNGNGKERDNSRVPFKLAFYRRLFERLEKGLRDGERILVMGDFNTAHQEIDLARPKDNRETSGFLPEEREEFDRLDPRRLGGHLPPLREGDGATTAGGASASACASATWAGGSTTCWPRPGPCPT